MKFKKLLSAMLSLVLAGSVSLPGASLMISAESYPGDSISTTYYDYIKYQIKNLPKPVKYVSYKYVRNTDENFSDGKYIFYNPNTNTVMQKKLGQWSSIDPINFRYFIPDDTITGDQINDDCIYEIKKTNNGKYNIINRDGKYLCFPYYGIMWLENSSSSYGEFTFEKAPTKNLSFIISTTETSENKVVDLDMYSNTAFTVHYHNPNGTSNYMQIFRQVKDVSINNDTTALYDAIIKAQQYYLRYMEGSEGTIDNAIMDYKSAYSGGVAQSVLDNHTATLNNLIAQYKSAYENDKANLEKRIENLFDSSDYRYTKLRNGIEEDYSYVMAYSDKYDLSEDYKFLVERAKSIKKRKHIP